MTIRVNKIKFLIFSLAFFPFLFWLCFSYLKLNQNMWIQTVFFLLIIFLPGAILSCLFDKKLSIKTLDSIIWGIIFHLIISFTAIIIGLTIKELFVTEIFICALMIIALLLKSKAKSYFVVLLFDKKSVDILSLIAIFLSILVILAVSFQGASFRGDPPFHLAILRKVVEGQPLSTTNLNYILSNQLHPAYGYPIWHVFLGYFSYLTNTDIFSIWYVSALPLTFISLLIWWRLAKTLMPDKLSATASYIFFLSSQFTFSSGYLFTRLSVPDTLAQLLLFPLTILLFLRYLYSANEKRFKNLILLFLLSSITGLVHVSQLVYFLLFLPVSTLIFLLFMPRQKDALKDTGLIGIIIFILIIVGGFIFESKGRMVSEIIMGFQKNDIGKMIFGYEPFEGVEILAKYIYMLLPILLALSLKNKKTIIFISLILLMPLAYWGPIKTFLLKLFGYITVNRLYSNVVWDFFGWGLIVGIVVNSADRFFRKFFKARIWLNIIINFALILLVGVLFFKQIKHNTVAKFFTWTLGSAETTVFLNTNIFWLLIISILISLIVYINQKFQKTNITKPTNNYLLVPKIIGLAILLLIISPSWKNFTLIVNGELRNISKAINESNKTLEVANPINIGKQQTIDFVKTKIPAKSVFVADEISNKDLPLFFDIHMANYPRTNEEKNILKIFNNDVSIDKKTEIIKKTDADYLFLSVPEYQGEKIFDSRPDEFKKIYRSDIAIYKLNF